MSQQNKYTLLDCTLRDGGYYTSWDFSDQLINDYLKAMKFAKVDVLEIGFRFYKNEGFRGACAFTTDDFLNTLPIPDELTISVMINAADLYSEADLSMVLEALFPKNADESPVHMVRIASHYKELERAFEAAGWLANQGFLVGVNLMQISERNEKEIALFAKTAQKWPIDVLYFADSMGALTVPEVIKVVSTIKINWKGPIGIHAHNNLGLALQNTITAMLNGATWLDATITGMGRGPGNTYMEELLIELDTPSERDADLRPLFHLVDESFKELKSSYGYGKNLFYYLAGKYKIHPTYIQEMLQDNRFDNDDIIAIIEFLSKNKGDQYNAEKLSSAREFFSADVGGNWNPEEMIRGKNIFILGSGPSAKAYTQAAEIFIKKTRPLVIALNTNSAVSEDLIDLRVTCHPSRLFSDVQKYKRLSQNLALPLTKLPHQLKEKLSNQKLHDFGVKIEKNKFVFNKTNAVIPCPLVFAYALAICSSGLAKQIFLLGFDGYPDGDSRNREIINMLKTYEQTKGAVKICSVGPTVYPLDTKSIFGSFS